MSSSFASTSAGGLVVDMALSWVVFSGRSNCYCSTESVSIGDLGVVTWDFEIFEGTLRAKKSRKVRGI